MNDLQTVTGMKRGMFPLASLNDGLIQFHRNAIWLHAKLSDKRRQSKTFRKFLLLTVDVQDHGEIVNGESVSASRINAVEQRITGHEAPKVFRDQLIVPVP